MPTPANYLSSLMTVTSNALKNVHETMTSPSSKSVQPATPKNANTIKLIPSHKSYQNSNINQKSPIPLSSKLSADPKLLEHYRNIYLNPNSK